MPEDATITVKSGTLRGELSGAWRRTLESGGPLVVTVNEVPEFVIYPLLVVVPLVHEQEVLGFARRIYEPLVTDRPHPPEGYETMLPSVGPDALRRSFAEECRRMRGLMTPFLYTSYYQGVGILFPIPYAGGAKFVEKLTRAWYPGRYEQVIA